MRQHVDRWLWRGGVALLALVTIAGMALVIALALGLNNPRPLRPPDWEAPDPPLTLQAPPDATSVELLGRSYGDFTLEVEAVPLSTSGLDGYGLVYRAQDNAHYYAFAIGSDGYYAVLREIGSEETALVEWQQFPHIHRGLRTNRLRVACASASCDFFINDEHAATVEDDTWLVGSAGLWARSLDDSAVTVRFERACVWVER
jgi:hypothetical protein